MNKDIKARLVEGIEDMQFLSVDHKEIDALDGALSLINELIPEGMVPVPEKPTREMLKAFDSTMSGDSRKNITPAYRGWRTLREDAYKAMLSAYKQEAGE